jgi:hypothetical protein
MEGLELFDEFGEEGGHGGDFPAGLQHGYVIDGAREWVR